MKKESCMREIVRECVRLRGQIKRREFKNASDREKALKRYAKLINYLALEPLYLTRSE